MATARQARARTDEQWLTTEQVAELTGYAAKTISNMRHESYPVEGPPWHRGPGGRPLYKRAEVVAWMRAKTAAVAPKGNGTKRAKKPAR